MTDLPPTARPHHREPRTLVANPDQFLQLIADGVAWIGIIGMGYVGLPLMLAAVKSGLRVTGFDIDDQRVERLNAGQSHLQHIGAERIANAVAQGRFDATTDFNRLSRMDAILICVPTPLGPHREPDLSYVEATAETIAERLRPGQLVVLESTTYPGTTRDVLKPILERTGLRSERDFWLAYSPEREDPGNLDFDTAQIPKLVGGAGPTALRLACALYDRLVVRTVPVASPETAEAAKLTENIFRAVNIALVNELKLVFGRMGIDVFEVIEAASTKPFGYMPFWPGPGLGGHCIPIDPFYLTWKANEVGLHTRFIELAGEINSSMPGYVVARLTEAIDHVTGKGLSTARVLIIGLAYKKDVDDIRESPALEIMEQLVERGADVAYHDPHVAEIPRTRAHGRLAGRRSVPLEPAALAALDAVLIVTDHAAVDWALITRHAGLVIDTRNIARRYPGRATIIQA